MPCGYMASLSQHMFGLNDRMDDADDLPPFIKESARRVPAADRQIELEQSRRNGHKNAPSLPTRPYVTVAPQSKGEPRVKISSPV